MSRLGTYFSRLKSILTKSLVNMPFRRTTTALPTSIVWPENFQLLKYSLDWKSHERANIPMYSTSSCSVA